MVGGGRNHTTRLEASAATGILTFPQLEEFPHLLHAMTGRHAPSLVGEREFNMHPERGEGCEHAFENRRLLAREIGIDPADTIWLEPDDTGPVRWVGAEDLGSGALDWSTRIRGADGFVAQCTNIALCTLCNDNVAVILLDTRLYSLGLVTIDARNPSGEPVEQAINLMIERGGAQPADILGLIAPSVGPCCYTFSDSTLNGAGGRSNLWDAARTATARSGLRRNRLLNTRICTACRDTEFFSRLVHGPLAGAGALVVGVMDPTGSLAETLERRKARAAAEARRTAKRTRRHLDEPSLMAEEKRLNSMIRCPYGQNKVYIRSLLTGTSDETTEPVIAMRCAIIAYVGQAIEGHNIVYKEHIERYCCADYEQCEAYRAFRLKQERDARRP